MKKKKFPKIVEKDWEHHQKECQRLLDDLAERQKTFEEELKKRRKLGMRLAQSMTKKDYLDLTVKEKLEKIRAKKLKKKRKGSLKLD